MARASARPFARLLRCAILIGLPSIVAALLLFPGCSSPLRTADRDAGRYGAHPAENADAPSAEPPDVVGADGMEARRRHLARAASPAPSASLEQIANLGYLGEPPHGYRTEFVGLVDRAEGSFRSAEGSLRSAEGSFRSAEGSFRR